MTEKSDIDRARKLLNKYGGEVDDYFKFWPKDKDFFFSSDGKAFLAYKEKQRVAVCAFDPVGPRKSIDRLMTEFSVFCGNRRWQIVFIQTTDKFDDVLGDAGLKRFVIGCDAVIPTGKFIANTVHNRYFRNIVNRFNKRGYNVRRHLPPHNPELIREIRAISDDWLNLPHHEEWQFLTGRFDEKYLAPCALFVLRDKAGKIQAFANEIPSYKAGVSSIDLMRYRRDSLPNTMDFLLIELIRQLHKDGIEAFNLGLSPLAGTPFAKSRFEKFMLWFYNTFQSFMRFKGLQQFKAKFQPAWEPRYVYIGGSLWHLPRIGLAIIQLMGRYKPEVSNRQNYRYAFDESVEVERQRV